MLGFLTENTDIYTFRELSILNRELLSVSKYVHEVKFAALILNRLK